MSKRVYISADYDEDSGDRDVVELLNTWGSDNKHKVDFIDMSEVVSGSVVNNSDCRICDLKAEFNRQINASSAVIIVIGNKTASRTAGSECKRSGKSQYECSCTPYKQNSKGKQPCKVVFTSTPSRDDDFGNINACSYLRHEFEQAKKKDKNIIVIYNSLNKQSSWLPSYMDDYKDNAHPFWIKNIWGDKVGDYEYIKQVLGYE